MPWAVNPSSPPPPRLSAHGATASPAPRRVPDRQSADRRFPQVASSPHFRVCGTPSAPRANAVRSERAADRLNDRYKQLISRPFNPDREGRMERQDGTFRAIGFGKNRIEALTGGIFAIAMTLLVPGMAVPAGPQTPPPSPWWTYSPALHRISSTTRSRSSCWPRSGSATTCRCTDSGSSRPAVPLDQHPRPHVRRPCPLLRRPARAAIVMETNLLDHRGPLRLPVVVRTRRTTAGSSTGISMTHPSRYSLR